MRTRRYWFSLTIPFVMAPTWVFAETESGSASPSRLQEVVVTATRKETGVDLVPATITTIDRGALDRRMPHDEAALFADEPDIVVSRDLRRYGATAVNIRGIDGIRVLQQVDGIRLPDLYYGGGPSNITGATPDVAESDFLKRVEVLRGPASSLYGSDALGGVVGYLTLDPQDILDGRDIAGRYRTIWRSGDTSLQNSAYGALQGRFFEALIALTRRTGDELDNEGRDGTSGYGRELPNPQDTRSQAALGKLIFKPAAGHRVGMTLELRDQSNEVETLRLVPSLPKVTASSGDEDTRRLRVSVDWDWQPEGVWFDRLNLRAYHQDSEAHTRTLQTRSNTGATCSASTGAGNNCQVDMDFRFEQRAYGLGLQMESLHVTGRIEHQLVYGIDLSRIRTDELRDYWVTNETRGTQTKTLAGDTYPLRDFAPGKNVSAGVFLQDTMVFDDGRLHLMPGVRYDRVELKPDWLTQSAGTLTLAPVAQDHSAVSPKLGALWQATPDVALFGQVVRGFRAPNYEEVNGLFYNAAQNYVSLPNAELEPERSTGFEIGARLTRPGGNLKLAVFENRYRNFIEQVQLCTDTTAPFTCPGGTRSAYQKVNLARVRIRGIELRGAWTLTDGLSLKGAVAHMRGRDRERDQPLNSVEPTRATLAVLWDREVWGTEARVRAAAAKSKVDRTSVDYFRTGSYVVADLSGWWSVTPGIRLNVSVNNLFDRKYYLWSDVRHVGLTSTEAGPAFYTQPGRNFSVGVQADF